MNPLAGIALVSATGALAVAPWSLRVTQALIAVTAVLLALALAVGP